jgi:hypothetical protein
VETTLCALCGTEIEPSATLCAICISTELALTKTQSPLAQAVSSLPASGVAQEHGATQASDMFRFGPRLLLVGGNLVAGLVLAVLIFLLLRSAGGSPHRLEIPPLSSPRR